MKLMQVSLCALGAGDRAAAGGAGHAAADDRRTAGDDAGVGEGRSAGRAAQAAGRDARHVERQADDVDGSQQRADGADRFGDQQDRARWTPPAPGLHGQWMGKPFEGIGYTGYDNVNGKYYSSWIDSSSTGMFVSQGGYDPASKSYVFKGEFADAAAARHEGPGPASTACRRQRPPCVRDVRDPRWQGSAGDATRLHAAEVGAPCSMTARHGKPAHPQLNRRERDSCVRQFHA